MEMRKLLNLMEGRYWDNAGPYENEAKELQKLVEPYGPSKTLRGEIFRAATKIYYDFYNNGFGNNWAGPAVFLMQNVQVSDNVKQMLLRHGLGNIEFVPRGTEDAVERMLSEVIEQIYTMQDQPNTTDMWDTSFEGWDFEPEYDEYDDEYDEYHESALKNKP